MIKNKYAALMLTGLCACAMASAGKNGESMNALPTVRLAIGMPVKALRAGSTYPFESAQGGNEEKDTKVFSIYQPYNLVYVDDGKELKLENIGEQNFFSAIMISDGKVDNISITPQREKLTLAAALTKAEHLFKWFEDAGFKADATDRAFHINRANGEHVSTPITSFQEAQASLLNPKAKIEEMQLFSLRKGGRSVNLGLSNARRMKARFEKKLDDESHAADEREYYLDLFITHLE